MNSDLKGIPILQSFFSLSFRPSLPSVSFIAFIFSVRAVKILDIPSL